MPSSHEPQDEFPERRSQKSRDKVTSNPLEPTTTGALLLQSLLRLHAPHNALVLDGYAQAKDPVPSTSDYVPVVSNHWLNKNCSRSRAILPVPASSTPSLTAQQFRLDHGVLFSVPWKLSSRTSSTTASVRESARGAGRRRTRISKYVAYSVLARGSE